jgi:hypothetical protein
MDYEETMVNEAGDEEVEELLPDDISEEEDESPEESLDSLMNETEEDGQAAEEQEAPKGKQGTSEPGYVAGRIAKAVEKAVAETEARLTAQFEAQYAPIRERMMEMEAQDLVKKGEVRNIEIARELVRARQGMAPASKTEEPEAQPRNAKGQYTSRSEQDDGGSDPVTTERIRGLQHQVDKIAAAGGPNVVAEFQSNREIKEKVIAGEMDFYDVADYMRNKQKKRPPSPMRSPNGVNGQIKGTIMSMTDKQFELLEKRVQEGRRYGE